LVRKPENNSLQYLERPDMYERTILQLILINHTGMICEDLDWVQPLQFLQHCI